MEQLKLKCSFDVIMLLFGFIFISGFVLSGCHEPVEKDGGFCVPTVQDESESGQLPENVREVVYMYPWYGTIPRGTQDVEDAINAITIEKINTRVFLKPVSYATFSQQISLSAASNEPVDLLTVPDDFMQMLARGQCMDMTELIYDRGQGILDAVGEFICGTVRDGRIYGITVMGGKAMSSHLLMRTDLLKETGIDVSQIVPTDSVMSMDKNLEIVEQIFEAVHEKHPQLQIFVTTVGKSQLESLIGYDSLGDSLGVLIGGNDYNVVNLYSSEEFRKIVELAIRWNEKGYMMKDAALNTASSGSVLLAGNAFCDLPVTQQGVEAQYKQTTGYDFTAVALGTPLLYTGQNVQNVNVLPKSCRDPEAAVDFLNLMYTDRDVVNLLAYGVEGKHYRFMPDGTVDYPEGVNAQNSDYPCIQTWLFGNGLLDYAKVGNVLELYEIQARNNELAKKSCAFGFMYDDTAVQSEVTACLKIVDEYKDGLLTGMLDIDKLEEFNKKLEAAGINDIIKEKQRQLDVWRAEQQKQQASEQRQLTE